MAAVVIATVAVGLLPDSADQIVRTAPPDNSQPRPRPILPGGERLHGYRVIHRDVIDGEQWQLLTGSDQAGRPCVELRARLGARQLCGDDFYPNRPFEEGSQSVAGTEVRFGPAAASVARIHLVLDDGTAIDATMIKPASGFPIRAWFAVIPKGSRVRIVAPLDANGLPAGSG